METLTFLIVLLKTTSLGVAHLDTYMLDPWERSRVSRRANSNITVMSELDSSILLCIRHLLLHLFHLSGNANCLD